MNKGAIFGLVGLGTVAVVAFLAFGVFGIHTAFVDTKVSEGGPEFDSGARTQSAAAQPNVGETPAATGVEPEVDAAQPAVVTERQGAFSSLKNYSVSGDVSVVSDGNQRFISFDENFTSSNGPDLKVYLRAESGDFVNLGKLSGNIGDQNYEVPGDTELETFTKVEIWCERFGVGFGEATLAAV